ncbi:MAG: hypothetical protein H7844_06200 [Nitrospirae bacterium YQR-1]
MALLNIIQTGESLTKSKVAPSAIVETGENQASYGVLPETIEDRLNDDEFSKAMTALEAIWSACPDDLPEDISIKHDHYLSGVK